jgi:hypothetical protein
MSFDEAWSVQRRAGCPAPVDLETYAFVPDEQAGALAADEHARSCEHCRTEVQRLRAERARFLHDRPPNVFMHCLLAGEMGRKRVHLTKRSAAAGILTIVSIAAALALWIVPQSGTQQHRDELGVTLRGARAKALYVYASRAGGPALPLREGEPLFTADVLRFSVRTPRAGYANVVNIDDRGRVTRYFPQPGGTPLRIQASAEPTLLPGSIRLDDFVGKELLAFLVTDEPLADSKLRAAFEQAYVQSGKRLEQMRASPLGAEVAFFMLRKPAR